MSRPAFEYTGRELEAMDFARNYHRWILDAFRPHLGGVVAEVGAGTGSFSELLLAEARPRHLHAVEPSANLFPHLKAHLGARPDVTLHHAYFADAAPGLRGSLGAVVYVNVMEHVPDDAAEARLAYEALAPGGALCLFSPALRWLYSPFDRKLGHYRRYHKADLRALAEGAGFRVETLRYFDAAGIAPWYVAFVLLRQTLGAGQVRWYDRLIVPVARRLEALGEPPLGKNLLLVARKP